MNKDEKSQVIEELRGKFRASDAAIFVDFRGLKVGEVTELRSLLRKEAGSMYVLKNNLAEIAAQGTSFESIDGKLSGPTAVVFADEVRSSAKVLTDFAKGHEKLNIKFCVLRGRIVDGKEAGNIAKLPSRVELLSKFLGLLNQPASTLLGQINAPAQQLVSVLKAWIDEREKGETSAESGAE